MFIESGNVEVKLFVRTLPNGMILVQEQEDEIKEDKKELYKTVVFGLKPLTWREHNDIQRKATVSNPLTGTELDWVTYKERKLCTILKTWDAVDSKGNPIPINDENILKLSPQIAEKLLSHFDDATLLDDEDRKN